MKIITFCLMHVVTVHIRYDQFLRVTIKMRYLAGLLMLVVFHSTTLTGSLVMAQEHYSQLRKDMVEQQIERRGVSDEATLRALRTVKRHAFVPATHRDMAYADRPLPIGYGQTISQPYIVGYMTEVIEPKPDHRVLEVGTGSGYQAAVLSKIVDSVFTIEIVEELYLEATNRLQRLGYQNVITRHTDGYYGWKEKGPFDAIVVTAASEYIPPPLIAQLKEGGKMIIPIGSPFLIQQLMLVDKRNGKTRTKSLMGVRFVPFTRTDK